MIKPGTKLYGFCNGYFGRDSYDDKIVIASGCYVGTNWMVAVDERGSIGFASGFTVKLAKGWTVPDEEPQ